MQLTPGSGPTMRARLRAAACVLLAVGAPTLAHAQAQVIAGDPQWRFDATGLIYSEKARTTIVEPVASIARLFAGGTQLSARFSLDAMTGASPSGAQASNKVQTVTSASGNTSTQSATDVPTKPFHDLRGALDLGWDQPIGSLLTLSSGGHVSRERDYSSLGGHAQAALDLDHHLVTLTFGGGVNHDQVSPIGGIHRGGVPTSDPNLLLPDTRRPKDVTDGLVGISRVLTRRWMVSANGSRTHEQGYLTEPYKVLSLIDATGTPATTTDGVPIEVTENRPATRNRNAVVGNSVYHLETDVLYASYRYYWDDWGVKSHTLDLKYHFDLPEHDYVLPHVRLYTQTQASFFHFALPLGEGLPTFASSDARLGPLHSLTLGVTYGFTLPDQPGDFTVRGEYIRQWGDGHPANAIGVQQQLDLFPSEDIFDLTAGYSVRF